MTSKNATPALGSPFPHLGLAQAYFIDGEDEEKKSEEEVAHVTEDVIEVDHVTNWDGAEEVVVAHVGVAGLQQLVLVVQHLGEMMQVLALQHCFSAGETQSR